MNDRAADTSYQNMAVGEFTPGKCFQLVKTKYASLNINIYGMARYLKQISPDTTWVDIWETQKLFRGGNGDFESHQKLATRFGASYCHSRENRFNNTGTSSLDNTQVRMSHGGLFFETGALAPGAAVVEADYDLLAVDLGFKYKGFALHTEFYYRTLSKFDADGAVPINFINDNGYTAQVLYIAVLLTLCIYGINSMILERISFSRIIDFGV